MHIFWIFLSIICNIQLSYGGLHQYAEGYCLNSTLKLCNNTQMQNLDEFILNEDLPNIDKLVQSLPAFSPTSSKNSECKSQSQHYLNSINDLKPWALKMYDASAKPISGLLNGNALLFGDVDQCLSVHSEDIKGKYCLTTIYIDPVLNPKPNKKQKLLQYLLDRLQSHNAMTNSFEQDWRFLPSFSSITWAVCVPATCNEQDVEENMNKVLKPYNITSGLNFRVRVQHGTCVDDQKIPITREAIYTIIIFTAIFLIAVWGTIHERMNTNTNGELLPSATKGTWRRILLAFSFKRNMKMLLDTNIPEDELSCIHGIRAVASLFIYIIHRAVFSLFYPYSNRTDVAEVLEGEWTMIFRAFWNWVDSFVIMSGLLTSFYAIKKLQQGRKINILRMYIQRYVKFTPMLFMLALALQNLMEFMVSSPQKVRIIDHYVRNCKRGLLPVYTYTNTFQGFENMCYPPSHQLATDMHMYLMSPFLILTLWKWPKKGTIAMLVLIVALTVLKVYDVYANNLGSFIFYRAPVEDIVKAANKIYINAIHRLIPYIFGVGLGYLLRVKAEQCYLTRVQKAAGTCIALLGAYYSFFGIAHASKRNYIFDINESARFAVFQPFLWSFSLCWLILCCATDQAPKWLINVLKWKGFIVFSRLSYAVYLTQIFVIAVNIGNAMTPEYFRLTKILDLNEIATILIISILCTLQFLLPLQDLWQIMTGTYAVNKLNADKNIKKDETNEPKCTKTDLIVD